jgi:hypothetical protein
VILVGAVYNDRATPATTAINDDTAVPVAAAIDNDSAVSVSPSIHDDCSVSVSSAIDNDGISPVASASIHNDHIAARVPLIDDSHALMDVSEALGGVRGLTSLW